jgi:cell division protein FtsZ
VARGENAAVAAARQAINCPLLEDTRITGAGRILINLTGSSHLSFHEVNEACALVREAAESEDAQLNFGVILDESMGDSVKVTVIATGVPSESASNTEHHWAAPTVTAPPPEPAPAIAEPEPEPEPLLVADMEPPIDLEDLDTPAYLRQGRLLN